MDKETAHKLNQVTSEFYAANAESFSDMRERPWDGWHKLMNYVPPLSERATGKHRPLRVLDIGCGNMRFEKMLVETFPEQQFEFYAVDNCPELAGNFAQEPDVSYQRLDIIECLEIGTLASKLDAPLCDLVVAFGFMHHIPLAAWREELLNALIERTAPDGIIALAFWQFANNEKLAVKAAATTKIGCERLSISLEQEMGDYLLGWQGGTDFFRYCHSFSSSEIAELERFGASKGASPLFSFSADGPDGKSNRYLLLQMASKPQGDVLAMSHRA